MTHITFRDWASMFYIGTFSNMAVLSHRSRSDVVCVAPPNTFCPCNVFRG